MDDHTRRLKRARQLALNKIYTDSRGFSIDRTATLKAEATDGAFGKPKAIPRRYRRKLGKV
jgi:hypothetical protein